MTWTEAVVVGGGQAGLAASHWLGRLEQEHVVLEGGRVGQAWRDRWPSLRLLTPNAENGLPGTGPPAAPEAFATRDELVRHLSEYAAALPTPVVEGARVERAVRRTDGHVDIHTSAGRWTTQAVVVATGHSARPVVPRVADQAPPAVRQLTAAECYREMASVGGEVLVVGTGPTGQQLAAELAERGCSVTIAVGRHRRLPRRYRGTDIWTWLRRIGELDRTVDEVADPAAARRAPSAALSGKEGGRTLDLGVLAGLGVRTRGRLVGFDAGRAVFDSSLLTSVRSADEAMSATLREVDRYVARHGVPAPDEAPPSPLQPRDAGPTLRLGPTSTVVWATGYRPANPWLHLAAPTTDGVLEQRRGVTPVPGLYVLGQRFQHRRSSHFLGGVGADARVVAEHVVRTVRGLPVPCHTPDRAAPSR